MSYGDGYFGIDPSQEDDYQDEIPEPIGWRYEFRDGSAITLLDFEDPVVEGKAKSEAREVADWIERNEAGDAEAIQYIMKNYSK